MAQPDPPAPGQPVARPHFEAAASLFVADGGPLAADHNPALLLAPDGTIAAANAAATMLQPLLAAAPAGLDDALAAAHAGDVQRLPAVEMLLPDGKVASLDLSLLPCDGGVLLLGRDISLERALRAALIDSRQRFKDLADAAADFSWEIDAAGAFSYISGPLALGHLGANLVGSRPDAFALADADPDIARAFSGVGPRQGCEVWLRAADGRAICLLVQAQALEPAGNGIFRGARGLARDITTQKLRETELAEARHRERLVLHLLRSLRRTIEPSAAIATALTIALQAVGADAGCVGRLAGDTLEVLAGEGVAADGPLVEAARLAEGGLAMQRDGERIGLGMLCRYDARVIGMLVLWRDAARGDWLAEDLFLLSELAEQLAVLVEQLKGHEQLRQLSTTDALTGLLNRRGFEASLSRAVERAREDGFGGALVYVDLDNFKQVNDHFGHARGDEALVATAGILRGNTRVRDPVGRLGGDEFVVWLESVDREEVAAKAEALQEAARSLDRFVPGTEKPLGFSIGIAMLSPGSGDSFSDLMARADEAMYRIKNGGKGGFVLVE